MPLSFPSLAPLIAALQALIGTTTTTERPEVVWQLSAPMGANPMAVTDKGYFECFGSVVRGGTIREFEYLPEDILWPFVVELYDVGADGNDARSEAYIPMWVRPDLTMDMIVSDSLKEKLGGSATPSADEFPDISPVAGRPLQFAINGGDRYVWNAVSGSTTAIIVAQDGELWLIVAYGQSNAEASNAASLTAGTRVATSGVIDYHRALMLNTGELGTGGTALVPSTLTDFSPAQEDATTGETGGSSFMRFALAADDAIGLRGGPYAYRTCGQSGQSITVLAKGGTPYSNLLATVTKARALAQLYGLKLTVPAYPWRQGEADADSMVQATYYADLIQLHKDLVRDIQTITRQRFPVWMLLLPLVAADGVARNITATTLAQLQAVEAGLTIATSCCPYWFNGAYGFNSGQNVHWTPEGKAFLVEFEARAMRIIGEAMAQNPAARLGDLIWRRVYSSGAWELQKVPFETSPRTPSANIVRVGATITGTVPYAEGGLAIYTGERGAATNSGFAWTPTSGGGTITGVSITNVGPINATWQVTLSDATKGGTLTYGITEQDATADGGPDCWGDIYDTGTEPSLAIPGKTTRQGLLPFSTVVA